MVQAHESTSRSHTVEGGSNRAFGIVFAIVFAIVGLWPWLDGEPMRDWSMGISGGFLLVALVAPILLGPMNRAWTRLGILLGRIVTPVAMGIVYFTTLAPIGLLMRLFGKDLLSLAKDEKAPSYWIERKPPGPAPETMKHQF